MCQAGSSDSPYREERMPAKDKQTVAAIELRDAIKALVKRYSKHEHLETFVTDLKTVARDVDILLDEVAEVR